MHRPEEHLPWGLLAAWVVNDAEEWFTMAPWSERNARRLESLPVRLPWPVDGMPARQARLAIVMVGTGIVAATAAGCRSGGRSPFFRASFLAFGLHGVAHVAQPLLLRTYTPGAITGAGVVIPFWLWGETVRRRAGAEPYTRTELLGAAGILAALPAVVAVAGALTRLGSASRRHSGQAPAGSPLAVMDPAGHGRLRRARRRRRR